MAPLSKLSLVVPVALYDPRGPSIERERENRSTSDFFVFQESKRFSMEDNLLAINTVGNILILLLLLLNVLFTLHKIFVSFFYLLYLSHVVWYDNIKTT